MSLCAFQEHPWAPRWPCRVPSLAGTGRPSSSGRPVTSTGTAPRERTRASCAVSRWPPTQPEPSPHLPTSLDKLPHIQHHCALSGNLPKLHGLQKTAKICVLETACKNQMRSFKLCPQHLHGTEKMCRIKPNSGICY